MITFIVIWILVTRETRYKSSQVLMKNNNQSNTECYLSNEFSPQLVSNFYLHKNPKKKKQTNEKSIDWIRLEKLEEPF